MQKINVKNILIIMLIAIEVIATYFMYKSSTNKEVVLDNVELKELIDNDSFAIYLDGKEYNETTWPASATFEKAECQNEKGDILNGILTFNEEENKAYINKTTQTTYCYIYFDSCKGPVGTVLEGKEQVSSCKVGGMYRYQGEDNVNNWICFGTSKDCSKTKEDINKYMYRIIGVTPEGELALLKETKVKEETTPFQWNDKVSITDCGSNGEYCTWNTSKLYNRLNGLCKTGNANCDGTETNIFINSNYYEYLTNGSVWLDKISNHAWKYGDSKELNSYNGDSAYSIESQFPNSIEAKIGLQYVHDYYYAYPGGNPGSADSAKNAWIHLSKDGISEMMYEWLISKDDIDNSLVYSWILFSNGNVTKSSLSNYINVRPVFYLNKDVTFKSGTGTSTDPYILNVVDDTPAPTCSFSTSSSGVVTLVPKNATSWYMSTSPTDNPNYGTSEARNGVGTYTYYGYVKNSNGTTGTCQLEMYQAKVNACTQTNTRTEGEVCGYTATLEICKCNGSTPVWTVTTEYPDSCPSYTQTRPNPQCPDQGSFCGYYIPYCSYGCSGGTTIYECSNGSTCTTSGCCSSIPCSVETCKSGYTTLTVQQITGVFCYK